SPAAGDRAGGGRPRRSAHRRRDPPRRPRGEGALPRRARRPDRPRLRLWSRDCRRRGRPARRRHPAGRYHPHHEAPRGRIDRGVESVVRGHPAQRPVNPGASHHVSLITNPGSLIVDPRSSITDPVFDAAYRLGLRIVTPPVTNRGAPVVVGNVPTRYCRSRTFCAATNKLTPRQIAREAVRSSVAWPGRGRSGVLRSSSYCAPAATTCAANVPKRTEAYDAWNDPRCDGTCGSTLPTIAGTASFSVTTALMCA